MSNVRKTIIEHSKIISFRLSQKHIDFIKQIGKLQGLNDSQVLRQLLDTLICQSNSFSYERNE